jgi:hypothetical protein
MKKRWTVFGVLLLLVVLSSGCTFREEGKSGESFSFVIRSYNPGVISNWTAVNLEFDGMLILSDQNRSVNFTRSWTVIILKASDDVMKLNAFPLGDNTYLIPAYWRDTGFKKGWNHVSLLAELKNGSAVPLDLLWKGRPSQITVLNFNAEIRESGDEYKLSPIGISAPHTLKAFEKTYRVLLLPADVSSNLSHISGDYAAFWNNKTLTFPRVNTKAVNGGTLITQHPMAAIYVASDDRAAFFDWVPFPYEELKKG